MKQSENILEVKNLKISFRTSNGTLKAVRDISFNLQRGRTLAIVGESGSGKSVTSKAILGIQAGNAITEGGEIIYDGRDLLRIDEEEMHNIRGDKISMIFQDPLSSLDPIVKIGPQITEAMLLKNKAKRKRGRKDFNSKLALVKEKMTAAMPDAASEISEMCETFDKFNINGNKLAIKYNEASSKAEETVSDIADYLFKLEKKVKVNTHEMLKKAIEALEVAKESLFSHGEEVAVVDMISELAIASADKNSNAEDSIARAKALFEKLLSKETPDFFAIGYYDMVAENKSFEGMTIPEINEMTGNYLSEKFLDHFKDYLAKACSYAFNESVEAKKKAVSDLAEGKAYFSGTEVLDKKTSIELDKKLSASVAASIDRLEVVKDSIAYTFPTSLDNAIDRYFEWSMKNPKEEKRFAKQTAKREALIAKGKQVDWKVLPKTVFDLDELKANIVKVIGDLSEKYEKDIENASSYEPAKSAREIIYYLREKAHDVVYKVTKMMAKEKAIRLMDEVGIPEPRIRFNQYPFEFSGGMRQRIVIAIALSANPDILICDEPTTALDVTIQAQILELINKLKVTRNLSCIFITHDLGVVANMADDIAVMYAGKIVEFGTADDIFYDPRHPYTWALLSSMPDLDTSEKLESIPGTPPNMIYPPVGDAFAARNKYAMEIDFEAQPPMFEVSPTHRAATWLLHPDAPKVEPPKIITDRIARMTQKGENVNG